MSKSPQTGKKINLFNTAVGKKIVMAVTGLALCLFLVSHLAANLLLLFPDKTTWFNNYAGFLNALPILLILELGLLAIFLIHAYEGFVVWQQNKAARGDRDYYYKTWAGKKSPKSRKSVASTIMMWSGLVILFFVALHVWQMKYHHSIGPANPIAGVKAGEAAPPASALTAVVPPAEDKGAQQGEATATKSAEAQKAEEAATLAGHVIYEFQKPYVALLYIVCMFFLGLHLYHAVSSSFQSLGAQNSKVTPTIMLLGRLFTIVIAGGFALIPIWISIFSR